jgi:hypothetical protein
MGVTTTRWTRDHVAASREDPATWTPVIGDEGIPLLDPRRTARGVNDRLERPVVHHGRYLMFSSTQAEARAYLGGTMTPASRVRIDGMRAWIEPA